MSFLPLKPLESPLWTSFTPKALGLNVQGQGCPWELPLGRSSPVGALLPTRLGLFLTQCLSCGLHAHVLPSFELPVI